MHVLIALLYGATVMVLSGQMRIEFLLFWLGLIVGSFTLYFELFVSAYLVSPQASVTQKAKEILKQRKFKEVFEFALTHQQKQQQPILHSATFQIALAILAFYVITSTTSLFNSGLVLGMALHLIIDEIADRGNFQRLSQMLFWNIHRPFSEKELRIYLWIVFGAFAFETLLLLT